jgi:ElaB/YqjD/DUF883 family membrane-anchored ribosome-binding protein
MKTAQDASAPRVKMANRFILLIAFVLLTALSTAAQSSSTPPKRPAVPPPTVGYPDNSDQEHSHMPEDMRARMEIARADADYKKTLDDADRLSTLSTEVSRIFHDTGKLAGDDLKKVGAIEKLAKRILSQAGGDEVDDRASDLQSKPLGDAVEQMNAAADKVQKCIKEQTRFVVSATVISSANEIIHLAQHIRRTLKAD